MGSPGTLNLGLIPLTKTTKILRKKKSQKTCLCAASDPHEKYIAPASSQSDFTKLDALLDSGTNAIFIDKMWAEKHKVPLTPL